MTSEKRKRIVLSIEEKLEALKRLDKGEPIQKIASELGVGRITVNDWKKNRVQLEKWCSVRASCKGLKIRKTMKKCEYEKVSEALFLWFSQERVKGMNITGLMLQEKALMFQKLLNEGEPDFTASVGWIDRWKSRHGLKHKVHEEMSMNELQNNKNITSNFKNFEQFPNDQQLQQIEMVICPSIKEETIENENANDFFINEEDIKQEDYTIDYSRIKEELE